MRAFTIPLTNAQLPAMSAGALEVSYNDKLEAVWWQPDGWSKPVIVPLMMLQSEMFAPVLMEINSAIENNKQSEHETV